MHLNIKASVYFKQIDFLKWVEWMKVYETFFFLNNFFLGAVNVTMSCCVWNELMFKKVNKNFS